MADPVKKSLGSQIISGLYSIGHTAASVPANVAKVASTALKTLSEMRPSTAAMLVTVVVFNTLLMAQRVAAQSADPGTPYTDTGTGHVEVDPMIQNINDWIDGKN